MRWKDRLLEPRLLAALAAFLIMTIVVVLIPVGIANNGELDRIMLENNLYSLEGEDDGRYFNYFVKDYGISQYYNDSIDQKGSFTTQKGFISLAVRLDQLFTGNDELFDVRFFGFLQVLLCTAAIYLFVDYLTYGKRKAAGYLIGALVVLILADTGYTAYFNSFYPNGLEYSAFLIAMTSIFLIRQKRYHRYLLLLLYGVCSFVFLFARARNAWAGLVFAVLTLLLRTKRADKNFQRDHLFHLLLGGLAALLLVCSIISLLGTPQRVQNIYKYNSMARGSLKTSQDREKTLSDYNVYRQFTLLHDTTFYDPFPIAFTDESLGSGGEIDEFDEQFYQQVSFAEITGYYITHPAQLYEMLKFALANAYSIRPQSTGNFLEESGREPGAKSNFFSLYSTLKELVIPRTVGVFYVWLALLYFFYLRSEYDVKTMTAITLIGVLQIFIAIIGSGDADMTRNMFLFGVVFDFLNILMISSALSGYVNSIAVKRGRKAERQKACLVGVTAEQGGGEPG